MTIGGKTEELEESRFCGTWSTINPTSNGLGLSRTSAARDQEITFDPLHGVIRHIKPPKPFATVFIEYSVSALY